MFMIAAVIVVAAMTRAGHRDGDREFLRGRPEICGLGAHSALRLRATTLSDQLLRGNRMTGGRAGVPRQLY
jgi:hypothetical protein